LTFDISGSGGFSWGLNLDDIWEFAGRPPPKSVVIPYLPSVRARGGQLALPKVRHGADDGDAGGPSGSQIASGEGARDAPRPSELLASLLKRHGLGFVRCWFPWNFFEQSVASRQAAAEGLTPSHDPFPLDDLVSKTDDAGVGIIGAIGTGYSRFLPSDLGTDNLHEYVERLTSSTTEIVRHYKDKVKVWQIENEPNWWKPHYYANWRKGIVWLDARKQETILRALRDVVRAESPEATIVINLQADNKKTNWKFYAEYCDMIGLDFYPNYTHSSPVDVSVMSETSTRVKRETGLPVFVSETGYPTGPRLLGYDEEKQAKYIRSACGEAFSCDAITGLGWFKFSDSYWKSFPFHENHFGLLREGGTPKLGWGEYVRQAGLMR
jgi:hypothetical protein